MWLDILQKTLLIFTDMYQHGFRLPFHPWVQMMLAKLGYALGQYNPNFWILYGVYIAWWLAGLGETTFEQFMYLYSISKQHGSFGWVQANCRKAKERGYFIGHMPSTQKSWRNRWCLAYGHCECPPGKTVAKHIPTHFQSIGSVKWGHISKEQEDEVERVRSLLSETERQYRNLVTERNLFESGLLQGMAGVIKGSTKVVVNIDEAEMQKRLRESRAKKAEKGGAQQATGKRPRDDNEGLVANMMGKRKALEEAHQDVMGAGPRLPPFDMQALPNDHRRHLLICRRRPILLGTKQILHQLSPMIIVPHKLRHIGAASLRHFKRTQSLVSLLYSQSGPVKSSDTNC